MTSHDVRKLRTCCLCKGLGIYKPNSSVSETIAAVICLVPSVPARSRTFAHPRCYMEEMGTAKLLTLPSEELSYIRMCDVPHRTMALILARMGPKITGKPTVLEAWGLNNK